MSNELLREMEVSFEVIQISSLSLDYPMSYERGHGETLYNPIVGANAMSTSFALSYLGDEPLTPTDKTFLEPIWSYY
jgi:hypothetical protein